MDPGILINSVPCNSHGNKNNNAWHVYNCIIEHILDKAPMRTECSAHIFTCLGFGRIFPRQALGVGHFKPYFSLTTQVFVVSGATKDVFICQYDPWADGDLSGSRS